MVEILLKLNNLEVGIKSGGGIIDRGLEKEVWR